MEVSLPTLRAQQIKSKWTSQLLMSENRNKKTSYKLVLIHAVSLWFRDGYRPYCMQAQAVPADRLLYSPPWSPRCIWSAKYSTISTHKARFLSTNPYLQRTQSMQVFWKTFQGTEIANRKSKICCFSQHKLWHFCRSSEACIARREFTCEMPSRQSCWQEGRLTNRTSRHVAILHAKHSYGHMQKSVSLAEK